MQRIADGFALLTLIISARSSTSVSLKAREVLILGQMPSYEERLVQMEAVLKNAVTNNYYGEQGQAPRYGFRVL